LLERKGSSQTLGRAGSRYIFSIPRATALDICSDPTSGYIIGGEPSIVVEPLPPDTTPPSTRLAPGSGAVCDLAMLRWSSDDPGWGVLSWDVQVRDLSQPNAPWRPWLTEVRQTSAAYKGAAGHTYGFRLRARDFAGNVEAFPSEA